MIPGVAAAVAAVNARGIPVVAITNQAAIGRGLYREEDFRAVNARIDALLAVEGARLDAIYHCPHTPEADCDCRKPRPGLLRQAAAELGLDLGRSVMVGDKESDLEAARAVGCRAVLVRTGYGAEVERTLAANGRADLMDACYDDLSAGLAALTTALAGGDLR